MENVSHVVLDEIHERDVMSDFLLIIIKDLLPLRYGFIAFITQDLWTYRSRHFIVSFLPKILGRNQDFSKGSVWGGEVTFQSAWGGRVLVRNLNFQISA